MHEKAELILRKHGADPSAFEVPKGSSAVWTGAVAGSRATDLWFALRDAFNETSLWPVLRGKPGGADDLPGNPLEALAAVDERPLSVLLADRLEQQRSFARDVMGLEIPSDIDAATLGQLLDKSSAFAFIGTKREIPPWPTRPPENQPIEFFSTHAIGSASTLPVVNLSLVALKHPWEAPAYLGFGGWNECPMPEIQVAALRDWFARFGAVPAAIAHDVMECVVARPPTSEADSIELAAEQWLFCDDIVSQGTMSFRGLAITLYHSPKWFFWWD